MWNPADYSFAGKRGEAGGENLAALIAVVDVAAGAVKGFGGPNGKGPQLATANDTSPHTPMALEGAPPIAVPAPALAAATKKPEPDTKKEPEATTTVTNVRTSRKESPAQEKEREELKKKWEDKGNKVTVVKNVEEHHVASDKDKDFLPKFKKLFDNADIKRGLQDPRNKVSIADHYGPHGKEYNQVIYDRLSQAVAGQDPHTPEYQAKFLESLNQARSDVARKGSPLNQLVAR